VIFGLFLIHPGFYPGRVQLTHLLSFSQDNPG
jgi:hypothetical protein